MKILITGNLGYVGPSVMSLLRKSYPAAILVGLDTGYFSSLITSGKVTPESKLDIQYFADVRRFPEQILAGVDAVVHLAAISNDPMGNLFEKVTLDINYRASIDLAKKAKKEGVGKFIFASSCSMYGVAEDQAKTEESELNPLTAYARSKVLTEQDLAKLADGNFKVTSLRFSTACGMSERLRLDLVLNDFVAGTVSSNCINILSDGSPWRPLINVKDMARAIDWAINRDLLEAKDFLAINVGSSEWNYQVKDLAEAVAEIIPNVEISINKEAQPDKRSYRVDFELFKKLAPNHQPKFDLVSTIKELREGLEHLGFNDKDFRESNLMRLKQIIQLRENGLLDKDLYWINR